MSTYTVVFYLNIYSVLLTNVILIKALLDFVIIAATVVTTYWTLFKGLFFLFILKRHITCLYFAENVATECVKKWQKRRCVHNGSPYSHLKIVFLAHTKPGEIQLLASRINGSCFIFPARLMHKLPGKQWFFRFKVNQRQDTVFPGVQFGASILFVLPWKDKHFPSSLFLGCKPCRQWFWRNHSTLCRCRRIGSIAKVPH